jgi:hypothetical protein
MLNAPYNGGTHLPDMTVVMPVFDAAGALAFYVAARGHQGDVGGVTPGSMPPNSRTVEEEGVLIENFLLVEGGRVPGRPRCGPCWPPADGRPQSRPEHRRPQGPGGRLRAGAESLNCGLVYRFIRRRRWCEAYMAARAGQRRGGGAQAGSGGLRDASVRL